MASYQPWELLAAAHAGCFLWIKFCYWRGRFYAGIYWNQGLITLDNGTITKSHLTTTVKAPGLSQAQFDAVTADAKANCPVSKLFDGAAEITMEATLA